MHCKLRRMKDEKERQGFDPAIKDLNEGWRSGLPQKVLDEHMKFIEGAADGIVDVRKRLHGRSAVAAVKYLLGDLKEAHALAARNWADAKKHEKKYGPVLRWMTSYAHIGSKALFRCEFEPMMKQIAEHWNKYYVGKCEEERKEMASTLSDALPVNPVLSIPRHVILIAAFNGSPIAEAFTGLPANQRKYWPSRAQKWSDRTFEHLVKPNELKSEWLWVRCWYNEARKVCADEPIGLAFSHAYAGFYFTLLYLGMDEDDKDRDGVKGKAKEAFEAIEVGKESPIASRYAKSGFYGIHELVTGKDSEKALEYFREAARRSAMSGNKFAIVDCLFMCCHAVAAQRVERDRKVQLGQKSKVDLKPEVNYYLKEARKVAEKTGASFYSKL